MKIDFHTARVLLFLVAISVPAVAAAISTNPADYAIVGENGVSMNSYCTCWGDIYSRGDLNL